MNITLEIIEEFLKEQYPEVLSYICSDNSNIDYIEILTNHMSDTGYARITPPGSFLPHAQGIVLFVCDPSELSDEVLNGLSGFCQFILTADDPRFSGFDRIILPDTSVATAYSQTMQIASNMHKWETKLLDALISNCNIQHLVDICETYFQNEVVIYDASGNIIAFTKLLLNSEGLQYWKKLEQNWYLDFNDISAKCGVPNILNNVQPHSAKFSSYSVVNKKPIIKCYVYEHNTWFACITVTEMNRPLKKADLVITNLLAKCVLSILKRDLLKNETPKTPEHIFLNDAVMGKSMSADLVSHMLRLFGWSTKGSYEIFVIGTKLPHQDITKQFELCQANLSQIAPHHKAFPCEDFLTAITNEPAQPKNSVSSMDAMCFFLEQNGLVCGVSLRCDDFMDISLYYTQAVYALEYCRYTTPAQVMCRYENIISSHIIHTFSQMHGTKAVLHPAVKLLIEHDSVYGSNLFEVLFTYLLYNKSHSKSSKKLFLHRNTFQYHLTKALDIIENYADVDDPETRLNMLLSFKLHEASLKTNRPT